MGWNAKQEGGGMVQSRKMENPTVRGGWAIGTNLHNAGEQARVEKGLLGLLVGEKYAEAEKVPVMAVSWTEPAVLMKKRAAGVTPMGAAS
jgi:hypothetical protein